MIFGLHVLLVDSVFLAHNREGETERRKPRERRLCGCPRQHLMFSSSVCCCGAACLRQADRERLDVGWSGGASTAVVVVTDQTILVARMLQTLREHRVFVLHP